MTERERLIELIQFGYCKGRMKENVKQVEETMADYLLENGVIVPPCKVGDTVYEFFNVRGFYDIIELVVENITVGINPQKCKLYCKLKQGESRELFYSDSFGKTLFFTKEEAEKELEEMKKND